MAKGVKAGSHEDLGSFMQLIYYWGVKQALTLSELKNFSAIISTHELRFIEQIQSLSI